MQYDRMSQWHAAAPESCEDEADDDAADDDDADDGEGEDDDDDDDKEEDAGEFSADLDGDGGEAVADDIVPSR